MARKGPIEQASRNVGGAIGDVSHGEQIVRELGHPIGVMEGHIEGVPRRHGYVPKHGW